MRPYEFKLLLIALPLKILFWLVAWRVAQLFWRQWDSKWGGQVRAAWRLSKSKTRAAWGLRKRWGNEEANKGPIVTRQAVAPRR